MDESPNTTAIRFYAGELSVTRVTTPNRKKYNLLNLPYYLVSQIRKYIEWLNTYVAKQDSPK